MSQKIVPVIIAGGTGTRLWPLSRAYAPKQFILFLGERTLFQETLERVSDPALYEAPIIVTNEDFRFLVAEQSRQISTKPAAIVLEPMARNTAAAIAAAAAVARTTAGSEALVQGLPSDHEIAADDTYARAVALARDIAATGRLVIFGILPIEPATGYGYIKAGDVVAPGDHAIESFVEKPQLEKARDMVAVGGYFWNLGLFVFPLPALQEEFAAHAPEVWNPAERALAKAALDLDFTCLDAECFSASPDVTMDYAIMEKTQCGAVVPSAVAWSDMGSWDQIWKLGKHDDNVNVTDVKATLGNSRNSLVISHVGHVAVQGMDHVAVIVSEGSVYVGRLDEAQAVGALVKQLAAHKETEKLTREHPTSYQPWGSYTSILNGERFQVKRILVDSGKKLSLQKHHHRSEHWIVVRGTAEVTIGDTITMLRENESVYIPQGAVHRLENPGKIVLELIEVQTGSYLGEDDIIQINDEFGRAWGAPPSAASAAMLAPFRM